MTSRTTLLSISLPALVLFACSSTGGTTGSGGTSGGSGGTSGGSGGSGPAVCSGNSVTAHEANDYSFMSTITLNAITVKPSSEITIDWSGVNKDFEGHSIDPSKDIDSAVVILFSRNLAGVEKGINSDNPAVTFQARELTAGPLMYGTNGGTDPESLFNFKVGMVDGMALPSDQILVFFDPVMYPPDKYTYVAMAATGTSVGTGVRQIQAFTLGSSSDTTTVKITSNSTNLTFRANMHSLTPTYIPSGEKNITLDWSEMNTNALGDPFTTTDITRAIVGNYNQSISDLEGNDDFLNLETIANKLYQGGIPSGTTVDFSQLQDSNGNGFSGIDGNGTWLVALQCGGCRNPAPWYLTVLKPCNN